jgi:hypothetical protein
MGDFTKDLMGIPDLPMMYLDGIIQ